MRLAKNNFYFTFKKTVLYHKLKVYYIEKKDKKNLHLDINSRSGSQVGQLNKFMFSQADVLQVDC